MNRLWTLLEPDPRDGTAAQPYPGLRPFLPQEHEIFFGREQMVDQVLVRLNDQHMVVMHGTSGCGKSSLVAAGVLPQLARRRARRGLVLRTGTFRPGTKPLQSLVNLIGELCGSEEGPAPLDAVYRAISGGTAARAGVARLAAEAGVDQICIVIDQFEELFRFAEDEGYEEAQRFADLLVRLCGYQDGTAAWWKEEEQNAEGAGADGPEPETGAEISFILTMRSEFLGNCARYPGLAEAINRAQYLLPNMERADLVRAICEPAEVFGGCVDHVLAEQMAGDALKETDALPLVQHALLQMWRASEDKQLTLADYERALAASAPDEASRQRPLSAILAGHADQVLAEVTAGDEARRTATEYIFRALTRKDSESRATRCPQRFRRLARISGVSEEETRAIVDAFRAEGVSFLTPYARMAAIEPDTVIDISHEALIRAWPQMSDLAIDPENAQPIGWIEREAQDAMLWRWLAVHADFFQSNQKAYLDGATTKRLTEWFSRIQARPDWVRPHLVRPEGKTDVTEETEWQEVRRLLDQSRKRTRFDRVLINLTKASFTTALIAVVIALGFYIYWDKQVAREAHDKQQESREEVKSAVQQSLQVSASVLREANARAMGKAPAADVEIIDEQTAAAATAAGSFINTPDATGYVWIGTVAAGRDPITNLRGNNRDMQPTEIRPRSRYWIAGNTIVRRAAPDARTARVSVGIVARGALVMVMAAPIAIRVDDRIEFWAQVRLAQQGLPRVRVYLANVPPQVSRQMATQLTNMGYLLFLDPPVSMDASGHSEVVYCREADRAAAVQLATTITRWLGQHGQTGLTVTPLRGDDCDGIPANMLLLMLDLAPQPETI